MLDKGITEIILLWIVAFLLGLVTFYCNCLGFLNHHSV